MPYADWNVPGVGTPFGDGMPHAAGLGMGVGSYNGGYYEPNPSPPYSGHYPAGGPGPYPYPGGPGGNGHAPPMPQHVAWQMSPPGMRADKGMGGNGIPTGTRPVFPNAHVGSPMTSFKSVKEFAAKHDVHHVAAPHKTSARRAAAAAKATATLRGGASNTNAGKKR